MCLQCITKSKEIGRFNNISVQISTEDHKNWPINTIGLVISNDPFFVFKDITFKIDPYFELSDNEIIDDRWFEHTTVISQCEKILKIDPYDGYQLYLNLLSDGYLPSKHGYNYLSYLIHKIAKMIETNGNK